MEDNERMEEVTEQVEQKEEKKQPKQYSKGAYAAVIALIVVILGLGSWMMTVILKNYKATGQFKFPTKTPAVELSEQQQAALDQMAENAPGTIDLEKDKLDAAVAKDPEEKDEDGPFSIAPDEDLFGVYYQMLARAYEWDSYRYLREIKTTLTMEEGSAITGSTMEMNVEVNPDGTTRTEGKALYISGDTVTTQADIYSDADYSYYKRTFPTESTMKTPLNGMVMDYVRGVEYPWLSYVTIQDSNVTHPEENPELWEMTFELDPKALRSNTFVEADSFRVTFEEMGIENPRAGSLTVIFTLSEEGELLSARLNAGYRGNIGEEAVEMTVESYELFAGQNTVKANIPEEVYSYPEA